MQEVQEAFFSASNGNLESLNNMLGSNYQTFEEAQAGIAKAQGGMVEQLSGTIPGLFSTIMGNVQAVTKQFMKPFTDSLSKVSQQAISFFEAMGPKAEAFGERLLAIDFAGLFSSFDFSAVTTALQPVMDLFSNFFTAIETKSPAVQGWMNILGTVFNTVWSMIGSAIEAVTPTIQNIFKFIGEHSQQISAVVQALGTVWNAVWKTVGALLQAAWTIVEPILSKLFGMLEKVANMVQNVGKWWMDMVNKIKNNPITQGIGNIWNSITGGGSEGRNAFGSGRIRKDDTLRTLHYGEKVLTRREADAWENGKGGNGLTIAKIADTVVIREEADIHRVAKGIVRELKIAKLGYGGSY